MAWWNAWFFTCTPLAAAKPSSHAAVGTVSICTPAWACAAPSPAVAMTKEGSKCV